MKAFYCGLLAIFLFASCKQKPVPKMEHIAMNGHLIGSVFDVRIREIIEKDRIYGRFERYQYEQGNKYIILNAYYKNISDRPQLIPEGALVGMLDTQLVFFSQIESNDYEYVNPGVERNLVLIYKVPVGVRGKMFYTPDAAGWKCVDLFL